MIDTTPETRRPRAAALPENIRNALRAAIVDRPAEAVAVDAEVSLATVRRAAQGGRVTPVVRAALARALGVESPKVAA